MTTSLFESGEWRRMAVEIISWSISTRKYGTGPGLNCDPWICSQTHICSQTRYWLQYAAWCFATLNRFLCASVINRLTNEERLRFLKWPLKTNTLTLYNTMLSGPVMLLVAGLIADPGVLSLISAQPPYFRGDWSWNIFYVVNFMLPLI